jgi:AcrR family transcriptional regulator
VQPFAAWDSRVPELSDNPLTETLARRALERSLADRHAGYVAEVQRIVDATYRLIERTGGVDPSLRDVLTEAGLSTQAFYRFFRSKDELMMVLLDDGRRRLVGYLEHRMARAAGPEDKVGEWIRGVLAQASSPEAAARTRPFVAEADRLAATFPAEQQASVELLVGLLHDAIVLMPRTSSSRPNDSDHAAVRWGAEAVYRLTFETLHHHLTRHTTPSRDEVDHLVGFALRGLGVHASAGATTRARRPRSA